MHTPLNAQSSDAGVKFPDPATDYHGHPKYLNVLLILFALFGISLLVGGFLPPVVAVTIIFVTAFIKAAMVVRNFMHLKYEPLLIWIAVAAVFFCLTAFFFGIYIDITAVKLDVVPR